MALALANLRLRESLRNQSIRDPLTGLFNRRYMQESLEREIHRANRDQSPIGVVMIDLDHFKNFNDTFGHPAGDALLRALAHLLQSHVRGEDIACRYGGEEFALILPHTSLDVTWQRAELLREKFKHLQPLHDGQVLGSITLSVGVAVYPAHGANGEAVLQAADSALYRAKHSGRDRAVTAPLRSQA
jgi:diguanylate cyclase (GGDEF)-like protein